MHETMTPLHGHAGRRKKIKTVILNGCESEPYVTSAHALMMSHPLEILKGAEIFRKALSAERILFVSEDNKLEAAELLKSKVFFLKWPHVETAILPALYPQDHEAVLRRRFSDGEGDSAGPFEILDVASAYAVWEAVVRQKPLYERAVTVAGECVIEPRNFWARIGTDLEILFKNAKGLLRPPARILLGGPMRGHAQALLEIPILKGTPALLALPPEAIGPKGAEEPCIRCGRCVEVCPSDISPVMITLAAERNLKDLQSVVRGRRSVETLCTHDGKTVDVSFR
jgi:electron transport complex protein RnfC